MKILNKLLSLVCIVALLFSAVPVHAQATPTLYFSTQDVTIGSSSTAYCFLQMKNAENISAMDYRILYDAANLEFSHMYNTGFTSQSDVTVSANTSEPGVVHITLISQNGLNGSNYLNLLYFKATKDAKPGTYPISVLVTDIYNSSLDTVFATTQKGTITIKEGTQTVKNISFSSTVSPSSLKGEETVNYKLSASSLNNLSAGTFDFTYDDTKLKFNGVTFSSAMKNTVYDINDSIDGLVKISFASEKAITSGSNLVTLNFSAIAPGSASIVFKSSDLYDFSFGGMVGNELTNSVTIAEPEVVIDYSDFKLLIPEDVPSDKEFTVKAVLEGGSGVRAGDFVVIYDSNVLECTGVNGETISGAWIVTDKNYSNGQMRFSLMSNVDLSDDTALVSINFKAKENLDSKSTLTATGTGVYDAKFNAITLEFVKAEVEVVRPEYTVNFYDSDGTTLLASQNVMSGNSAIPPKTEQIRKSDDSNHLKFVGWDKDYSVITDNTDFVAVYTNETHTIVTQSAVDATCTETGLTEGKYCVVCDEILIEQEVVSSTGHTEVILPREEPTCTETGLTEGKYCSVCNETLIAQTVINENGHTTVVDKAVAPTCIATGLTEGSHCSVCNEVLVAQQVIPANGHTEVVLPRVEPTCTEAGLTEGKYCSVCNETLTAQTVIKANGHTTVVDKAVAPTCTATGLTEGSHCSVCKEVLIEQRVVPVNGHTEVVLPRVEPTCTETGLTEGKYCSVCNETLIAQTVIEANGHTTVIDKAVAPTCIETGLTKGSHCSVCSTVLVAQQGIPANGHTEVILPRVEPTCTETGLTEGEYCSVCDETLVAQTVIKANGHTTVVDKAITPSCTDTGLTEGSHCSVCNEVLVAQQVIPANGHTEVILPRVESTCTENGLTEGKYCSVCDEALVAQTVIKANGHTVVVDKAVSPTCTATGLTEGSHCSICNEVLVEQQVIPANGHTEVIMPRVEPTCTETGLTEGKYCSVCDEALVAQTIIDANGHTAVATPDVKPGITTPGYSGGTHCDICGEVLKQPEMVPATGMWAKAILGEDGTLVISGALSDNSEAVGTTLVAIYDSGSKMLELIDITELDQTGFAKSVENMTDGHTVKVLQWKMNELKPLCEAIEVCIEK